MEPQDAKRSGGLDAGKRCDEEYNFFRRLHCSAFRRVTRKSQIESKVRPKRYQLVAEHLSWNCQNSAKSDRPLTANGEVVQLCFS